MSDHMLLMKRDSTAMYITYQQTAIDLNVLYPLATALHIAILSAHKVSPYEAFSTLHPVR